MCAVCETYVKRVRNTCDVLTHCATGLRCAYGTRVFKKNINRGINKMQARTRTHFTTFVFLHLYVCVFFNTGKNRTLFWANRTLFYPLRKRNLNINAEKTTGSRNFWICRKMCFVWVFEAVCVHAHASQSKTGSVMKAFDIPLNHDGFGSFYTDIR